LATHNLAAWVANGAKIEIRKDNSDDNHNYRYWRATVDYCVDD